MVTLKKLKLEKAKVITTESLPHDEVITKTKPEPVVEIYNGKKVISKGEVEINGVKHKTITTEEGSTYTI